MSENKQNKQKNKRRGFESIKALTVAAMLTAMSVVIGIFCKNFLNFGGGLFRITFENLPIIVAGIAFGPFVGGMVGVAGDLVSYLLSSQVYPPNLIVTLGAALMGIISGVISRYLVTKRGDLQVILSGGIAHIVASMIVKSAGLFTFYGWAILWRIPIYLIIAPIEIFIICLLFRNNSFRKLMNSL